MVDVKTASNRDSGNNLLKEIMQNSSHGKKITSDH